MEDFALLLEKLAEKFGTTVEHLWGVMVSQAHISAIASLVIAAIWCVTCVIIVNFVSKKTTDTKGEDGSPIYADWQDDGAFAAWGGIAILIFISLLAISFNFESFLSAILNPEYWALMKLKG